MEIIGIYSTEPNLMSSAIKCLVDVHNFEQVMLMPSNLGEDVFFASQLSKVDMSQKEKIYDDQSRRCLFVTDVEQAYWIRKHDGKIVFFLPIEDAKRYSSHARNTRINMQEGDFLVPICSLDDNDALHDILASVLLDQHH